MSGFIAATPAVPAEGAALAPRAQDSRPGPGGQTGEAGPANPRGAQRPGGDLSTGYAQSGAPVRPVAAPPLPSALYVGGLRLVTPLVLAPLAGWTTLAFRLAIRDLGGLGLTVTEVVSARSLIHDDRRTWDLLRIAPSDHPIAAQMSARTPSEAAEAARRLAAAGFDAVDLNLGCPVRKISRKGGGAALGVDALGAAAVAAAAVRAVGGRVTAKLRLGWGEGDLSAPEVARALEEAGVAAITIHGRTRAQCFAGSASLDGIRAVREAVTSIPVIGNGDILRPEDALRMVAVTGVAGVMIGRGAIADPFIFRDTWWRWRGLDAGAPPPPTRAERVAFILRHYEALAGYDGERLATERFRKILRAYGLALGAGQAFAALAVRIACADDVRSLCARLLADEFPREPPPAGGVVPAPKRPVDHW